jgi:hypothetical protein
MRLRGRHVSACLIFMATSVAARFGFLSGDRLARSKPNSTDSRRKMARSIRASGAKKSSCLRLPWA